MDIVFNCPHCSLEIEVDQEASGQEFDCPTCQKTLTVPDAQVPTAQPVDAQPVVPPSPMAAQTSPAPPSSVPSLGEKRMVVPVSPKSVESLIQKPNKSLDLAAKESKPGMRVKTIRHSDCKEVGKDRFDDIVSDFLNAVGEENIISITPINYSYVEMGTQKLVTDFGMAIVYKE